jgi:nitrate/nitrite transport system ATP-binding protein
MLDSMTRVELQDVLIDVWSKEKITAIMVTHDVDEAIFLSDRVIMMTSGPYAKVGEVAQIKLDRPRERRSVIEHPDFYKYRQQLLTFLDH